MTDTVFSESCQSVQRLATGWTTGIRFSVGTSIFLFATMPKPALGLTQPPVGVGGSLPGNKATEA
jgi:hypothetical protein